MPSKAAAAKSTVAKAIDEVVLTDTTHQSRDAVVEAVEATFAVLDDAAETGTVSNNSRKRLGRAASGLRSALATDAPRRPIRTAEIAITLDGYPSGVKALMRINPPMREYEALSTDTRGTLRKLILHWNLPDDFGQVVELDDNLSGATDEELAALLQGWYEALKQRTALPKA